MDVELTAAFAVAHHVVFSRGTPMTRGALEVETPKVPLPSPGLPGAPLRIICPTYWYPQHANDTQATYVHDINRHLARRGNQVTVVTPGDRSLPAEDSFDGVDVVRFPMELPSDLTYGRVAQGKVSLLGRFARLAVMSHYMEAQYRATVSVGAGPWRRRGARALGDSHRPGRRAGRAPARGAMRDHHARRRRVRESGAGVRLSHPVVRAAAAPLDPAPRERAHRDHRGLPAARAARRGAGAVHPADLQWHRPPPLQPLAQRQRAWIRASGRR